MGIYTTINPATGETIQTFPEISDSDLQNLISQSDTAFRSWRNTEIAERKAVLHRVAEIHRERAEELGNIITLEMGKPSAQATGEIGLVASIYDYYADNLERFIADEPLDIAGPGYAAVRTQAVGPLIGIMPWNFPFYQVARFAAPNIALGNTILLKHSRNCPQSALAMEEIFLQAGLPEGVYLNAFVSSKQVADAIADPRIQGVSLTGSETAGAAVAEVAGRNLKKCVLELGGSDPFIVFGDADLDAAAKSAAAGRLGNSGQACTNAKRFLIQEEVYDEFVEKLVAHMESFDVGPLSSDSAVTDIQEQLDDALTKGATPLLTGGSVDGKGAFFKPALLGDVTPDMRAYREELFGPVGVAYRFNTLDDAIELANDSPYGLSSTVFTADADTAREIVERLEVGMVWINSFGKSSPDLPFGGVKLSGYGRELGRFGFDEFSNKKLIRNIHATTNDFFAGFNS